MSQFLLHQGKDTECRFYFTSCWKVYLKRCILGAWVYFIFCTCCKAGLEDFFSHLIFLPPDCRRVGECLCALPFQRKEPNEILEIPEWMQCAPFYPWIPWARLPVFLSPGVQTLIEHLVPLNPEEPGTQHLLGNTIWFLWIRSISLNIRV